MIKHKLLIADLIYVTTFAVGQRLGRYKTRINNIEQIIAYEHLDTLLRISCSLIRMEPGKHNKIIFHT